MSAEQQDQDAHARLLRHLGQPGAFGLVSALGCGRLSLGRTVNGATLGAGYAPMAAADSLVADGLACWSGAGRSRRLILSGGGAAPGRALASRLIPVDGQQRMVLVDERESPLLWLHRRMGKDGKPQISAAEFAAGERFRADLTLARMLPRVTMNWDAASSPDDRGQGGRDPAGASDASLAARQRVRQACDRLGPELSGLAIDVCGFLKGLDLVERERRWPARSAKIVLRLALAGLVSHYGLGERLSRPRRSVWQASDARPRLMPEAGA
jgi:hypothetical protein